jgi:hypothetical protein
VNPKETKVLADIGKRAVKQESKSMSQLQQQILTIDKLWACIGKLHLQVESQADMLGQANREIARLSKENARLKTKYEPEPKAEAPAHQAVHESANHEAASA